MINNKNYYSIIEVTCKRDFGIDYFDEVIAYVVAPCKLISIFNQYDGDKIIATHFNVVFDWKTITGKDFDILNFDNTFNIYHKCCKTIKTDWIFNNIDDAKICRKQLEKILVKSKLASCPKYKIKEVIKDSLNNFKKAHSYEERCEKNLTTTSNN